MVATGCAAVIVAVVVADAIVAACTHVVAAVRVAEVIDAAVGVVVVLGFFFLLLL